MDESSKETEVNSLEFVLKKSILPKNKLAIILETEEGTQYCCVECPARYSDKEKLEVHLCSHNKEYRFLCGICGTGLKRKEHLDRHTLGHQEVRPHVCGECGKGFKRKEHLNIHRSIHTGDKSQICPICQRSFYRKDHLQKHLQTHNKLFIEQNIYPMSEQEMMDIKQELDDEVDIKPVIDDELGCIATMEVDEENTVQEKAPISYKSSDPERPFACVICHKTYKRKDHLKLHSYTHLEKDKICSECGKAFHKQQQLLAHMTIHIKPHDLQQFNGEFMDSSSTNAFGEDSLGLLVERAWSAPGAAPPPAKQERRHACDVCGRRFKRKQHLKVHANVHTRLQPTIWCSLCNEGFHSNPQFEKHQCLVQVEEPAAPDAKKENDHPEEIRQPLSSPTAAALSLEDEQGLPTPARVYVCKYCSKPFKRKDHYKIHLHIHTGVKSFFCPDCGKGFYRKDHLQKHSQVHQKARPRHRTGKAVPDLYPIGLLPKKPDVKPEITITAPSNTKLRVPLQIKVPYQMVLSMENGQQRAVNVDPLHGVSMA